MMRLARVFERREAQAVRDSPTPSAIGSFIFLGPTRRGENRAGASAGGIFLFDDEKLMIRLT